jgi:predicted RND superfamily exporter protein
MTRPRLCEAIFEGSARRLRPGLMTFANMSIGLVPILWATGTGSEIMKRIAAPMVCGIVLSFILVLLVYPAVFAAWREWSLDVELSPEDNVMAADVGLLFGLLDSRRGAYDNAARCAKHYFLFSEIE